MPIANEEIRQTAGAYLDAYPDEAQALSPMTSLLADDVDITVRTEFRGHATAGAVLVNPAGEVLHIHHVALDRWLRPGGHLEASDSSLHAAALRELVEETGIEATSVAAVGVGPVHIDVHMIPANEDKGEPEHPHFDFRFVFMTAADVGELQAAEVSGSAWLPADTLAEPLRDRVRSLVDGIVFPRDVV